MRGLNEMQPGNDCWTFAEIPSSSFSRRRAWGWGLEHRRMRTERQVDAPIHPPVSGLVSVCTRLAAARAGIPQAGPEARDLRSRYRGDGHHPPPRAEKGLTCGSPAFRLQIAVETGAQMDAAGPKSSLFLDTAK